MFLFGIGFKGFQNIRFINVKESTFLVTVLYRANSSFITWNLYLRRDMLVAEKFIHSLVDKYGKHTVYTDGGTWYDEACNVIGLKHYLHSSIEKKSDGTGQSVFQR